jgi:hypothetical protein
MFDSATDRVEGGLSNEIKKNWGCGCVVVVENSEDGHFPMRACGRLAVPAVRVTLVLT